MDHDQQQVQLPQVHLRIPGTWNGPDEFQSSLPQGCTLHEDTFTLPCGSSVELTVLPADDQFEQIFLGSCTREPSQRDVEIVRNFTVNVCLTGPGGSVKAAELMLKAGAAVLHAGGGGVFVDNSGLGHGSDDWHDLADSVGSGGEYWAYVASIRSDNDLWSLGMHVLGYRDAIVPLSGDEEADFFTMHEFLGYTYRSGAVLRDGELLGGDAGRPWFRAHAKPMTRVPQDSPMHNPYGVWQLTRVDPPKDALPMTMAN